jgi:hypothetical protein
MTTAMVRDWNDIKPIKASSSARYIIEDLLTDAKCFDALKPFYFNGSPTGHKMMDQAGAVAVLKFYDQKNGGHLARFVHDNQKKDVDIANWLRLVLRSKYVLGRAWKVEQENDKKVLPAPVEAVSQP